MIWWLPVLLACKNEELVQPEILTEPELTTAVEIQDIPLMSINEPARGSFDSTGSGIVRGTVNTAQTNVAEFTVNGEPFDVEDDGEFNAAMSWTPGIQILGARVEAENGERAVDGRAFHAGPTHEPAEWIEGAIRMEIDSDILDDDDEELDDIAGLLEEALEDDSILSVLIGTPVDAGGVIVTPTNVNFGRAWVDLVPGTGQLQTLVSLEAIELDFDLAGVDWYSWLGTFGSAWATRVDAYVVLTVASSGGTVRAEAAEVDVSLSDFGVTVEYVPDFLEGSISGWVQGAIEDAIADVVEEVIAEYVASSLEAFAVGASLSSEMELDMRLAGLEIVPDGVRFEADARLSTSTSRDLPNGAGSLATSGSPPDWPEEKSQSFWAAVDDDLMNQLAFTFWQSGAVDGIELDAVLLGGLAGGPLPPPLGPADTVDMSLGLPPVMTPADSDEWAAKVAVGEWRVRFNRTDGEVLDFSVNARADVDATVDDEGQIELTVNSRPVDMDLAIGVIEAPDSLDPGDLAALVRLMIPPLLGNAGDFAPKIPIPVLPLDEFVDVPATEGKELIMSNPTVKVNDDGWMLLESGLDVR